MMSKTFKISTTEREYFRLQEKYNNLETENAKLQADCTHLANERNYWQNGYAEQQKFHTKREEELLAIIAELKDAHWTQQQLGHDDPCTYGSLCPYCEIERLKELADSRLKQRWDDNDEYREKLRQALAALEAVKEIIPNITSIGRGNAMRTTAALQKVVDVIELLKSNDL